MCDTCNLTGGDSHQIPDVFLTEAAAALGAAQSPAWVSYSFPSSLTSGNQNTSFNTLEPALHTPIPNTILYPREGEAAPWSSTAPPCKHQAGAAFLHWTAQPIQVGSKPGKPDLNRQSRRKMSCPAWHEQQIPGPALSPGCVKLSVVFTSASTAS